MLHEPVITEGKDAAASYKSRVGVWMFVVYALFYAGFVFINLYSPLAMEREVLWGLNLATVYGFALIVGAFVLALVYDRLCRRMEAHLADASNKEEVR